MFAPKVAKPQTKVAENPTSRLTPNCLTLAGPSLRDDPVQQALFLQHKIGNQAMLRFMAQQTSDEARNVPGSHRKQEATPENNEPHMLRPAVAPSLRGVIQAELAVGPVDDPLEREAGRVADQVVRMPATEFPAVGGPSRLGAIKCPDPEAATAHAPQAQSSRSQPSYREAPPVAHEALRSPGLPLDPDERAFFELRFGYDFSRVRVHADGTAAAAAAAVNAAAFTLGGDIVFAAGRYAPKTSGARGLLGHELAHVVQQSGTARPATLQRQSVSLPDFQQKGDTCDPASLTTALILWDRENAGSGDPNANIVGVCNAALIFMMQSKASLVQQYSAGGADGAKTFNDNVNQLTAMRGRLRGAGTAAIESEYQSLSTILSGFGADVDTVLRKLGLKKPATESRNDSLAEIFADSALNALKPGEVAQILWYMDVKLKDTSGNDLGTTQESHAFLIGRAKAGAWFLSNQADTPPLHLEAATLADLRAALDKAKAAGKTRLSTDPSLRRQLMTAAGVNVLPQQDYSQPFRALASPGTFLAEVDETTICCGERVSTWDFVGTAYSDKDIDALLASSGTGHGFLVGEMPAGVFSVYKTNPVTDKDNVRATKIDTGDSTGGLLVKSPAVFVHAWLKVRTASDSSATGKGFQVY